MASACVRGRGSRRRGWSVLGAAAIAAAAGSAGATTPLRLDYCVEASGGGVYSYTFTLTLDNHDGSWQAGHGWDWLVFGDASGQSSPLADFVVDPTSFPVGPWTSLTGSGGGHNGPTFNPVTEAYWIPTAVGESLTWRGTSSRFLDEPLMLFSTLIVNGPTVHYADFEVAHRLSCNQTQGACCRPDGTCIKVSQASCTNEGGVYQGNNSQCANVNCPQPPTGACCRDSGCAVVSQAICTSTGGVYHGNNSPCATAGCAPATAYLEGPDAGETPGTAAVASGSGSLSVIHGTFNRFSDADLYRIRICDPANFSGHLTFGGLGEVFLFKTDGTGIADRYGFNGPATITNQFTSSLPSGDYLFGVAVFFNSPLDNQSLPIWQTNPGHFDNIERAPDGPGAANPLDHWDQGGGQDGAYTITLTGACFVPAAPPPCYANCDASTNPPVLNVADFTCFLQKYAAGCP